MLLGREICPDSIRRQTQDITIVYFPRVEDKRYLSCYEGQESCLHSIREQKSNPLSSTLLGWKKRRHLPCHAGEQFCHDIIRKQAHNTTSSLLGLKNRRNLSCYVAGNLGIIHLPCCGLRTGEIYRVKGERLTHNITSIFLRFKNRNLSC